MSLAPDPHTGWLPRCPMVDNPTADFTDTPWWLSLIKAVC